MLTYGTNVSKDEVDLSTDSLPSTWTVVNELNVPFYENVQEFGIRIIQFDIDPNLCPGPNGVTFPETTPGAPTIAPADGIPAAVEGASSLIEVTWFPDGQVLSILGVANEAGGFDPFASPAIAALNVSAAGNFLFHAGPPTYDISSVFGLETQNANEAYSYNGPITVVTKSNPSSPTSGRLLRTEP